MQDKFFRCERICNVSDLHYETDNRGYMIFRNVAIARSGVYQYYGQEIGKNSQPNKIFRVYRHENTYKSDDIKQSLENIPVTDDHPDIDVSCNNYSVLEKGHTEGKPYIQGKNLIVPKIVIKDKDLQDKIKTGKREVSIGFLGNYKWGERPSCCNEQVDGTEHVYKINHLAVVSRGKAGPQYRFNKEEEEKVKDMDIQELKNALSEFTTPISNKLEQVSDSLVLANARLDQLENAEHEKEKHKEDEHHDKKHEKHHDGVVNPSMNKEHEHGHIDEMSTREGSGEKGGKELVEMVYPETKKIVTKNARVLSLINAANELVERVNKEMKEHEHEEHEEHENTHHKNALESLENATDKIDKARNEMAKIPAQQNHCGEAFSQACEGVINASEELEDVSNSEISRGARRINRKIFRLERLSNVLSPEAPQTSKEGHSEDDRKHREYLTRGANSERKPDPLIEMNRPAKVKNAMNEVSLDFSLDDGSPFSVPNGFMEPQRTKIRQANSQMGLEGVGSGILSKMANVGMGAVVRSFDVSQSNEGQSFLADKE